jgi:hypothetical protein
VVRDGGKRLWGGSIESKGLTPIYTDVTDQDG